MSSTNLSLTSTWFREPRPAGLLETMKMTFSWSNMMERSVLFFPLRVLWMGYLRALPVGPCGSLRGEAPGSHPSTLPDRGWVAVGLVVQSMGCYSPAIQLQPSKARCGVGHDPCAGGVGQEEGMRREVLGSGCLGHSQVPGGSPSTDTLPFLGISSSSTQEIKTWFQLALRLFPAAVAAPSIPTAPEPPLMARCPYHTQHQGKCLACMQ